MAYDVFVSYSNKDKAVADTIVASLERNNIRCWYAPRDIKPGSDWGEEIAKAINETSVFLLIFSSSANRSRRVLDELNLAISKEAAILPFRIEKLEPSGAMQLHLSTIHWLDAIVPSWEKHIDQLMNIVSINLGGGVKAAVDKNGRSKVATTERKKKKSSIVAIVSAITLIGIAAVFGIPKLLNQNRDSSSGSLLQETTPGPSETSTVFNTPEPQTPALGSAENPIVWMYVPPENVEFNDVNAAAEEIAKSFGEMNDGLIIKPIPASSTKSIIDALCGGEVHLGSLDAFSYLAASNRNCADAKLIWSAYEDIKFGGEIIINANSGIESILDLEGKTLCIPSFGSASGWDLPSLEIWSALGDPTTHLSE
ncbi:TIR domain-containing protein, partial [bacterium]|nr:TIR domain-containing protein [bacterium]